MSHFLCGEISFRGSDHGTDAEYDVRLFRLIEAGAKRRLYLQFGANISQKIIFDIIASRCGEIQLNPLPFFAVGSPVSNTSDELFYPPSPTFSPNERIEYLKQRIDELSSWVNSVFDESAVVQMCIYLTEGYDSNYEQRECSVRGFPAAIREVLLQDDEVPSTKILIGSG